jgi:oligopeptide/dipeptide ABC transporter ATP-binding protein
VPDPDVLDSGIVLEGDVPSPIDPPAGCRFHPRCRYATDICRVDDPPLTADDGKPHPAACHHPLSAKIGHPAP